MVGDGTFEVRFGTLLLVGMGDVIRHRRLSLGLSQAELASRLGVDVRQIRRYEADTAQPTLQGARLLAELLDVSLDELAGSAADYSGTWWSAWQGASPESQIAELVLIRRGSTFEVNPSPQADVGDGSWRGELRTSQDDLLGWFVRDQTSPRRGTLLLRPTGTLLQGAWMAADLSSGIRTGLIVLAREKGVAQDQVDELALRQQTRFDRS